MEQKLMKEYLALKEEAKKKFFESLEDSCSVEANVDKLHNVVSVTSKQGDVFSIFKGETTYSVYVVDTFYWSEHSISISLTPDERKIVKRFFFNASKEDVLRRRKELMEEVEDIDQFLNGDDAS